MFRTKEIEIKKMKGLYEIVPPGCMPNIGPELEGFSWVNDGLHVGFSVGTQSVKVGPGWHPFPISWSERLGPIS